MDHITPPKRLSLIKPNLDGLKLENIYTFNDENIEKNPIKPEQSKPKKKRRRNGKKTTKTDVKKRKTLPPVTLNTPSLQDLKLVEDDAKENNSHVKVHDPNARQNGFFPSGKTEKKELENEDSFLEFELNDAQEARDLNDLIDEEIKKITEQKDHIIEFENHVKKDIKVIFEATPQEQEQKGGKKAKYEQKAKENLDEDDVLFSTFKGLQNIRPKSPDKNKKSDEEYSIINEAIKIRLQELENKKKSLHGFKSLVKECLEKDAKFEDDDYANNLDNEFNKVQAENEFLKNYKNMKEEESDVRNGVGKLKASIMKETYDLQEAKKNLQNIRKKVEGSEQGKITPNEVLKAKEGIKHELVGMMSSIRNSNNLIDFTRI